MILFLYLCLMKDTFLTFIENAGRINYKNQTVILVKCQCDCGNTTILRKQHFVNKSTKSCGCLNYTTKWKTHGMAKTRTYRIWANMLTRCTNTKVAQYKDYGGRGISVCKEWAESFESFFKDMGSCPSNSHSIDRIDNNLNYCKENCKWSTSKEQCNNKSNNVKYLYSGELLSVTEISRRTGIVRTRISNWKNRSGYSTAKIEQLIKQYEKTT